VAALIGKLFSDAAQIVKAPSSSALIDKIRINFRNCEFILDICWYFLDEKKIGPSQGL
jgi:hypothetical protein